MTAHLCECKSGEFNIDVAHKIARLATLSRLDATRVRASMAQVRPSQKTHRPPAPYGRTRHGRMHPQALLVGLVAGAERVPRYSPRRARLPRGLVGAKPPLIATRSPASTLYRSYGVATAKRSEAPIRMWPPVASSTRIICAGRCPRGPSRPGGPCARWAAAAAPLPCAPPCASP